MSKRLISAVAGCAVMTGIAAISIYFGSGRARPAGSSTLAVTWIYEPREAGAIISTPATEAGRIYVSAIRDIPVAARGAVICLDAASGKPVWTFDDEGRMLHMYSSCTLAEGRLYVGEGMHANPQCRLYCLDREDGRKLWDFTAQGHIESTPVVAGGRVLFGAGDDGLYCLDATTGAKLWHYQAQRHIDATVVVREDRVYATSGMSRQYPQSAVLCLSLPDGGLIWETPTDLPAWGSPALAGDAVLVGLGNGRLTRSAEPPHTPAGAILCLDADEGRVQWRFDVPDAVMSRPLVHAGDVCFGCRDGYAYCADLEQGQLRWKQNLHSPIVASPIMVDARLCFTATAGQVYLMDPAVGTIDAMFDLTAHTGLKSHLYSPPAVAPDGSGRWRLYLGAELEGALAHKAAVVCLVHGAKGLAAEQRGRP